MNRRHDYTTDASGAFCADGRFHLIGAGNGPLARMRLAVKDNYEPAAEPAPASSGKP